MVRDIRDYINEDAAEGSTTEQVVKNSLAGERLDSWVEQDWQGRVVAAFKLEDDFFAVVSGYFGSCAYCDPIMGASRGEKMDIVRSWVNSARTFESLEALRDWIDSGAGDPEHYSHSAATHLSV